MINHDSIRAVAAARQNGAVSASVKPLYESYCWSQIPATMARLLTGSEGGLPDSVFGNLPRRYDKVVTIFLDAFGWRFFEKYSERYPFLKRFLDEGVASKITTQFPSTTAAHVTTLHSGLEVGQTGVFEWYMNAPEMGGIITPLLYAYAGGRREPLPAEYRTTLFPQQTIYEALKSQGVQSFVFQSQSYAHSTYSTTLTSGAQMVPFTSLDDGLTKLSNAVLATKDKAYFVYYYDAIDAAGHYYGPGSGIFDQEVDAFMRAVERLFYSAVAGQLKNTLLVMIADHGQMEISPITTIYLNRKIPGMEWMLKTDRHGKPLMPGGSARDLFVYVKEDCLEEAGWLLAESLRGHAEVRRTSDLIAEGYFGQNPVSEKFKQRVGDLVVLPGDFGSVWWYESGVFEQRFYGHHGGISPQEMETIFLVLPCD